MSAHRTFRSRSFLLAFAALSTALAAQASPTDFAEVWALSADRSKALALLIPGSSDYCYYRCRERLLAGDLASVPTLLAEWRTSHPDDTARQVEIQNRLALLGFAKDPAATFAHLRQQLGLRFDAERRDPSAVPDLPTRLDPALLQRATLWQRALADHQGSLGGVTADALPWLAELALDDNQLRQFLVLAGEARRPDLPNLPALVVRDLATADSKGFGSLPIHGELRREHLDACLAARPELLQERAFVIAYLRRLAPSSDVDLTTDASARAEHLAALWAFTARLSAAFGELKSLVLQQYLLHDLRQGLPDQGRLVAYLQVPRIEDFVNREWLRKAAEHALEDDDLRRQALQAVPTLLPGLRQPEALIRTCLQARFAVEDSMAPYAPYLDEDWLRVTFAEAKLLHGHVDPQRWHALLRSPELSRAIEQRVELEFPPTLPRTCAANDRFVLEIDTKNTPQLLVRVFAIDAFRWHQQRGTPVDLSIPLDGLVPTHEQMVECKEPPIRRVRRRFELPQLDAPGTYVIECIGNGLRSRAVVHKGQLRCTERRMAAGHLFRVYDEAGAHVPDAALWFGGRDYTGNQNGEILVPFASEEAQRTIVLHRGERSSLASFAHAAEQYSLRSFCHVDRESLIAGHKAKLLVRPELTLAGQPVALSLLQKPVLTLVATDLDGISTTSTIRDLDLADEREFVHQFAVPQRLQKLSATLSGVVRDLRGNDVPLTSTLREWSINGNDAAALTHGLQLVLTPAGHALELRGKNGEPKANRVVKLAVPVRGFRDPVRRELRTDDQGRVDLGALPDVDMLQVECDAGSFAVPLPCADFAPPRRLHGLAGETLRLPYQGRATSPSRDEFALLAADRDAFGHLAIADGFLELRDLPPGDYELRLLRRDVVIPVAVTRGVRDGDWLLGASRRLEAPAVAPLHVRQLQIVDGELQVTLANPTAGTRLAVVATRYDAPFSLPEGLATWPQRPLRRAADDRHSNLFSAGTQLGGEHRYVLERRFAEKYLGNLLPRPSLLLNPWELQRTTTAGPAGPAPGGAFEGNEWNSAVGLGGGAGGRADTASPGNLGNLDFLATPSTTLANLRPGTDGIVRVKLQELGFGQILHVLAIDGDQAVYDSLVRPEAPLQTRNRALSRALDGAQHLTERKQLQFVAAGGTAALGDPRDAKVETFDSLTAVHALLSTISRNDDLATFAFVLRWPQLDAAQKRALYSEHACHELHFFLYHKDRAFFDAVCKPFLANKHHRTFLDHWLLGDDLRAFTEPWAFAQLNLVERILLAQRLGEAERTATARCLREALELRPVDPQQFERLLEQTIAAERLVYLDDLQKVADAKPGASRADAPEQAGRPAADPAAKPRARMAEAEKDRAGAAGELQDDAKAVDREEAKSKESAFDSNQWNSAVGLGGGGESAAGRRRNELAQRGLAAQLYRAVEPTKLLVEHDWWHRRIHQATADAVQPNRFWLDYATAPAGQPFASAAILETGGSFLEMMMALAVLDLPFTAGEHTITTDADQSTLRAATPLLLAKKEVVPTDSATPGDGLPPLLLGENFFRQDDRYRFENGEQRDVFVTGEFVADVVYGCQVVVTNPTSQNRLVDLLLQIPAGAIPVQKGFWTKSTAVVLGAYATRSIEYSFYFPGSGSFAHYPVHAADHGKLAAYAEPRTLQVVDKATQGDGSSWAHVSQHGSSADVLAFVDAHNVHRLDLTAVAWRMRDRTFSRELLSRLRQRHVYDHTLWSYGILHQDADATREYLRHAAGFLDACGGPLQSPLVTIDPIERKHYQHLELDPLVLQRAHPLNGERRIGNRDLQGQFAALLTRLGYQPSLTSEDWLVVTYYLLLQDRIADALAAFAKIEPAQVQERLQYDYLSAYLAFFTGDATRARAVAERHRDHPVPHWRRRFAEVLRQLDEAEGKVAPPTDAATGDALAAQAPALELGATGRNLTVRAQNLPRCEVRYYVLDVEFAFSARPFADQNGTQAAFVQPNLAETRELPPSGELTFELPPQFHRQNVLVEVRGGGLQRSQTCFANALAVRLLETQGQLAVAEAGSERPLPKTYVKVFARLPSGEVRFHKDGYTDLRGRFDYASLSDDPNANAVRYAVLVLHEQFGAVIREVAPPTK
jgi:hypothetical protein